MFIDLDMRVLTKSSASFIHQNIKGHCPELSEHKWLSD